MLWISNDSIVPRKKDSRLNMAPSWESSVTASSNNDHDFFSGVCISPDIPSRSAAKRHPFLLATFEERDGLF